MPAMPLSSVMSVFPELVEGSTAVSRGRAGRGGRARMLRASAASVIMREPASAAAERCTACSPAMISNGLCQ